MVNGCLTHDPHLVSNQFNDYFISIGTKLADEIISTVDHMPYIINVRNSIYVPDITELL